MAAKVKVLDNSETSVPGIKRAFMRDFVYIALMIVSICWFIIILNRDGFTAAYAVTNLAIGYFSIGWVFLELGTMLMNSRRRALHDFIGGTVVVNEPYFRGSVAPNA